MALLAQATASAHIVTLLPMVGGDWLFPDKDGFDLSYIGKMSDGRQHSEQARMLSAVQELLRGT